MKYNYETNEPLHPSQFNEVENVAFPAKGYPYPPYYTPPHPLVHTFKFKTYAPKVFKAIREFYDIDPVNYMHSVCGKHSLPTPPNPF